MSEHIEEPFELFANMPLPPPRERTAKDIDAATNKVTWTKYRSQKRVHCYACLEARFLGLDVEPQRAAWSRMQGGVERLLCREHAQRSKDQEQK